MSLMNWLYRRFATTEMRAARIRADKAPYPTMAQMGLRLGDRVVWDNPDHLGYVGDRLKFTRSVHCGTIIQDWSQGDTMYSGERFVELDTGLMVSTKYLRRA